MHSIVTTRHALAHSCMNNPFNQYCRQRPRQPG
jgi:hypothetical protein